MKRPEEVKLEFTRQWVRKAESDFRIAQYLFASGEDYLYGVEYRYPGDYPQVTFPGATRALALSRRVRKEIRRLLPKEVLRGTRKP